MKIVQKGNSKVITMSRDEWIKIGRKFGWSPLENDVEVEPTPASDPEAVCTVTHRTMDDDDHKDCVKERKSAESDGSGIEKSADETDKSAAEEKAKDNPWAICTDSVGREDKDEYEDCVMAVKKELGLDDKGAFSEIPILQGHDMFSSIVGKL